MYRWIDELPRKAFLEENKLRLLRKYQVRAIERIQEEVKEGKTASSSKWQPAQERL